MNAAERQERKRWWAAIGLGAVACSACCIIAPALIAVGLVGGGTVLASAHWLEPAGFVVIIAGLIGLTITQLRRHRRRAGGGSATEDGTRCGCDGVPHVRAPAPDHAS